MNSWQNLLLQTERFRSWATTYPAEYKYPEWESGYEEWPALYQAFLRFLEEHPFPTWSEEQRVTALYVIARDNGVGASVFECAKDPERLLYLAAAAAATTERDAKWQIAAELGKMGKEAPYSGEAESLLAQFCQDEDEYVRRRALSALGQLESPLVERLVEAAWSRPDQWQEYQRMAVLQALSDCGSPQLESYLVRADEDGRQYLMEYAARIRSSLGLG